jgi:predicted nucleotidyltransferase
LANVSHSLTRAEAEALLKKIIAKARTINSGNGDRLQKISCVVVFGSYLRKASVLGDVDIGVALDLTDERRLAPEGLSLAEWFRKGSARARRTYSALRLRKPDSISIHKFDEVVGLRTPYRVIFGKEPEK